MGLPEARAKIEDDIRLGTKSINNSKDSLLQNLRIGIAGGAGAGAGAVAEIGAYIDRNFLYAAVGLGCLSVSSLMIWSAKTETKHVADQLETEAAIVAARQNELSRLKV